MSMMGMVLAPFLLEANQEWIFEVRKRVSSILG
jgi:hypothetical protein